MEQTRTSFKERVGYGLGDAASSMFWKMFSMYLLIFYTDIFGISAAAAGTMFLVTRIWDSLFDPIVGIVADRTHSKYGKFRPYILWIAIPFALIAIFTFYTPDLLSSGKLIYAYITYSLMMMIYSLINVPYASLMGVMSDKSSERTILSSYRMVFAFGGSLLALGLIEPLLSYFNVQAQPQKAWTLSITVMATIAALFLLLCFSWTKERIKPVNEQASNLKEDIKDLLRNKPWWILLGAGIAALVFNSIRDGGAAFYFKYYISNQPKALNWLNSSFSLTTLYLLLGQAANIIGVIIAAPIAKRIGKKSTFATVMSIATVLSIFFYFLQPQQVELIMFLQVCISICAGVIFPLLWSMYADIADYSELKTGRRATGLIFSSSSMSQKFGWTIGGATTGWLLGYFGFQANTTQSDGTLLGIQLMLSILPAIGTAASVIFILFYPLNEKRTAEIANALRILRQEKDTKSIV